MKEVLFLKTDYCGGCKVMLPQVKVFFPDVKEIRLYDEDPRVEQYNIKCVPTIIIQEDGVEVARHTGSASRNRIEQFLKQNI